MRLASAGPRHPLGHPGPHPAWLPARALDACDARPGVGEGQAPGLGRGPAEPADRDLVGEAARPLLDPLVGDADCRAAHGGLRPAAAPGRRRGPTLVAATRLATTRLARAGLARAGLARTGLARTGLTPTGRDHGDRTGGGRDWGCEVHTRAGRGERAAVRLGVAVPGRALVAGDGGAEVQHGP